VYNLDPALDISGGRQGVGGATGRAAKKPSSLFFCSDVFFRLGLFLLPFGRPAPVRAPPWLHIGRLALIDECFSAGLPFTRWSQTERYRHYQGKEEAEA